MDSGATLRYTGARPRRRSLESLIKQANLYSSTGTTVEDTRDSADEEEVEEEDSLGESGSGESSGSSSVSESDSESSSSSSSQDSNYEIEEPDKDAPQFFQTADIMEREFRSAFMPGLRKNSKRPNGENTSATSQVSATSRGPPSHLSSQQSSHPPPLGANTTINEVCDQLQSILSELTMINQKMTASPGTDPSTGPGALTAAATATTTATTSLEDMSRVKGRVVKLGGAAVELGHQSVKHFGDRMRLAPTPEEFKESHPRQLLLLNKMRAAIQKGGDPAPLDKIHSVYSGQVSSNATTLPSPMMNRPTGPAENVSQGRYATTMDDYLYSSTPTQGGAGNAMNLVLGAGQAPTHLECKGCHRHYNSASALAQHERSCGSPAANSPPSFTDQSSRQPCRHCGRLMTQTALTHHENICIRIFHGRRSVPTHSSHDEVAT